MTPEQIYAEMSVLVKVIAESTIGTPKPDTLLLSLDDYDRIHRLVKDEDRPNRATRRRLARQSRRR